VKTTSPASDAAAHEQALPLASCYVIREVGCEGYLIEADSFKANVQGVMFLVHNDPFWLRIVGGILTTRYPGEGALRRWEGKDGVKDKSSHHAITQLPLMGWENMYLTDHTATAL
jgi:hypothetical protein